MENRKFLSWLFILHADGRIVEKRPFMAWDYLAACKYADRRAKVFIDHLPHCQISWEVTRNIENLKL